MRYLSILTLSFFLASAAKAAPLRVVMENVAATNNAIYISTQTGQLFVMVGGTLTVVGNAFSVGTTSFTISGGSATVAYQMTAASFAGSGLLLTTLDASQLTTGTIPAARIGTGAIDTTKLASDAVTTVKILDANVTTAKIANGAVDTTKLATDAVTTIKILDANVTTAKIANSAVDTTKLALGAVTTNILGNAAVDTTKLATDAVTNVKILNGTIDLTAKVTGQLPVANGGTGAASLTAHGVVVGEGTSAAVVLPAIGSGGIVIGNGTTLDPSTGTLTATSPVRITKAVAGLTIDTVGVSSACLAGQYWSTSTITNGIITGGGCVTAASGGGGLSSIQLATGTIQSDSTLVSSGPVVSTGAVVFASNGFTVSTNGVVGLRTVAGTVNLASSTVSGNATSASYKCELTGSTVSLVTGGNPVDIELAWSGNATTANKSLGISVFLDGVNKGTAGGGDLSYFTPTNNSGYWSISAHTTLAAAAGTHNFCFATRTDDSSMPTLTGTIIATEQAGLVTTGFAGPASSSTIITSGYDSPDNATFTTCSSSVAVTTRGGDVDVEFNGPVRLLTSAAEVAVTILKDGQFDTGYLNNRSMASANLSASASTNLSVRHRFKNVSAGAHTFCAAFATTAGDIRMDSQNFSSQNQLTATEVILAAGTGDVSSNGNNTLTGTNIFSGKVDIGTGTPALSSCGASPTLTTGSNNQRGQFTPNQATCTLTFSTAFTSTPFCLHVVSNNGGTQGGRSVTTTAISFTGLANGQVYDYMCLGN